MPSCLSRRQEQHHLPCVFVVIKAKWSRIMTRTLTTLAAAATVIIVTVATPTEADARWRRHHHGFPVGAIIGGLAATALISAALAAPRYYGPYAYEPVYLAPRCYLRRERVWNGRRWRVRPVEVCY